MGAKTAALTMLVRAAAHHFSLGRSGKQSFNKCLVVVVVIHSEGNEGKRQLQVGNTDPNKLNENK